MYNELKELVKNAYSPYYKFNVAAIVKTTDGNLFKGVNVENANGTSICAERNALASAVAAGYRKDNIEEIYIMAGNGASITPCFACRQVILEFMQKDKKVICVTGNNEEINYTVEQLCPYPFEEEDLK